MARTLWVIVGLVACSGPKPPASPNPDQPTPEAPAEPAPQPAPAPVAQPTPAPEPSPGEVKACGGIAGLECPAGSACTDNPDDDCDPKAGAADCIGICKPCEDPSLGRTYMSRDPDQCARMKFMCADGQVPFGDACGCGCI